MANLIKKTGKEDSLLPLLMVIYILALWPIFKKKYYNNPCDYNPLRFN